MKVMTMCLADVARVTGDGKLDVLGGGWNLTGPNPRPCALALSVEVSWAETGVEHEVVLELLDDKGEPVVGEAGEPMVRVDGKFMAHRPAGVLLGVPTITNVAIPVPPLPLEPASAYTWRLTINGTTNPDWELGFRTRPRRMAA